MVQNTMENQVAVDSFFKLNLNISDFPSSPQLNSTISPVFDSINTMSTNVPATDTTDTATDTAKASSSSSVKTDKQKKAEANYRCKRLKTLMQKTHEFVESSVGCEAILIVKNFKGQWVFLGSEPLEQRVLNSLPIIDKDVPIKKYSDTKALSFKPDNLPAVIPPTPTKIPSQLSTSLPGASSFHKELVDEYKVHQGSSKAKNLSGDDKENESSTGSSTKRKPLAPAKPASRKRKSTKKTEPKKEQKQKQKRFLLVVNAQRHM